MGDLESQPIEEKPIEEKSEPVELAQLTLSIDKSAWTTMPVERKAEYAISVVDGALAEKNSVNEQLNAIIAEEEQAYWDLQREYEQKRRELELKYAKLKSEVVE